MKKLIIKLARGFCFDNDSRNIEMLSNGYVFGQKYYKTLDEMTPDLMESLKRYFNGDNSAN